MRGEALMLTVTNSIPGVTSADVPTLAAIVSDREPLLRPLRSGGGTHRASTNRTAGGQSTARSTGTGRSSGLHSHHKGDVDRALAAGSVIEGAA